MPKKMNCHGESTTETSPHPSHSAELPRVKRIQGQLAGVERMIQEGRYCVDILMQVKAARAALLALEGTILEAHLGGCVKDAFAAKKPRDAEKKIREITELLRR